MSNPDYTNPHQFEMAHTYLLYNTETKTYEVMERMGRDYIYLVTKRIVAGRYPDGSTLSWISAMSDEAAVLLFAAHEA